MRYLHSFLFTMVAFGCTTITKPTAQTFPRIVKNGCGFYSIQISFYVGDKKDTTFTYIGLESRQPHSGLIFWASGSNEIKDTIEILKKNKHNQIWATLGDTTFDGRIPYELQFPDSATTVKILAHYRQRVDLEKVFTDSINICHIYH
jgi:hypothetical protein